MVCLLEVINVAIVRQTTLDTDRQTIYKRSVTNGNRVESVQL